MLLAAPPAHALTLTTAYGPVEIDGEPQRVITLDEGALDTAVAAGVIPVAAVATRGDDGVARYLRDRVGDIDIVGTLREANIEAVIAHRPDLILASPRLSQAQYALLSQIAPTVVPVREGFSPESWKAESRLYARALKREASIDEAIRAVEERAHTLAERQPEGDTTATVARWMTQGPIVMSTQLFAAGLLAASGYDVKDGGVVPHGRPHSDPLSLENLSRIDTDRLFLATINAEGDEALANARQSPAFARLDVVRRNHVEAVDGQLWSSAYGPLAAQRILDDIDAALTP